MMQPTQDFFFSVELLFFILLVAKHTGTDWDMSNVPDASGTLCVPTSLCWAA